LRRFVKPEKMHATEGIADFLGVDESTVRRQFESGDLPGYKDKRGWHLVLSEEEIREITKRNAELHLREYQKGMPWLTNLMLLRQIKPCACTEADILSWQGPPAHMTVCDQPVSVYLRLLQTPNVTLKIRALLLRKAGRPVNHVSLAAALGLSRRTFYRRMADGTYDPALVKSLCKSGHYGEGAGTFHDELYPETYYPPIKV